MGMLKCPQAQGRISAGALQYPAARTIICREGTFRHDVASDIRTVTTLSIVTAILCARIELQPEAFSPAEKKAAADMEERRGK